MHALREIREMTSQELVVKLPPEFVRKQVEIIVLCAESEAAERPALQETSHWERDLDTLSWNMGPRLYPAREELYDRNLLS